MTFEPQRREVPIQPTRLPGSHSLPGADPATDDTVPLDPSQPTAPDHENFRRGKAAAELLEAIRLSDPGQIADVLAIEDSQNSSDAPQSIGRFRILRELGRGGHGIVFLAEDPRLRRLVALKVPRPEAILTADMRKRFLREAEAAAALNHPNIVPIFEQGAAGPICYVASGYCSGPSLGQWLQQRSSPVSIQISAQIVQVLADAVQHAHSRGVLHRDLKPANVLWDTGLSHESTGNANIASQDLTASKSIQDAVSGLRLTDFGLARIAGSAGQTLTSAVLGTPAYMSPEQAAGDNSTVGPAADIYGLGVILYQLLTLKVPIMGRTDIETLRDVQLKEPTPPRRHRPEIPRDLEAICLKCLEKSPAARYASAADLHDDLGRFLSGDLVRARPVRWFDRFARTCRRNPAVTAVGILAALFLLVGISSVIWQWRRAEENLVEAHHQQLRATKHLRSAQDAVDQLLEGIAEELRDLPQTETIRERLLTKAAAINNRLIKDGGVEGESTEESARGMIRAAAIAKSLGRKDEAAKILQDVVKLESAGIDPPESYEISFAKIRALCSLSGEAEQSGDFSSSHQYLMAGLAIADTLPDGLAHRRQFALAEINRSLGILAETQADLTNAGIHFQRAVDLLAGTDVASLTDLEHFLIQAKVHSSFAIHSKQVGNFERAMTHYQTSQLALEQLDKHSPGSAEFQDMLAMNQYNQANLIYQEGDLEEARKKYLLARDEYKQLALSFPRVPKYRDMWCRCLQGAASSSKKSSQVDQRLILLKKAAFLREELLRDHPEIESNKLELARACRNLAKDHMRLGEYGQGRRYLLRSIECLSEPYSSEIIAVADREADAWSCSLLARLEIEIKNWEAALEWLEKAISTRLTLPDASRQKFVNDQLRDEATRGFVLATMGHIEEGISQIKKVVQAAEASPLGYLIAARGFVDIARHISDQRPDREGIDDTAEVEHAETRRTLFDEAITCLEKACHANLEEANKLALTEEFQPYLEDVPRFRQLMESLSLKEEENVSSPSRSQE
jgi:serine/threonine protein kinase